VGGWITDNYSWHWLFFINLVPGIFVTIVVPLLVRIDKPNLKAAATARLFRHGLMALFLGCLEYTLEEGPRWDWFGTTTIRTTAWISGIAGVLFVWRSLTYAAAGGRPAGAEEPQLRARLLLLLRDRHRHLRHDLPDAAVPRPGARASARCRSAWRCSRPASSRSARSRSTPILPAKGRSALADDVRAGLLRAQHVEFHPDHP
jgi:hypothetical protein